MTPFLNNEDFSIFIFHIKVEVINNVIRGHKIFLPEFLPNQDLQFKSTEV